MELKNRSVAYIVSNFPCYSETFVLSELVQLRAMGVDITIFSLRGSREKQIQEAAKPLLAYTFYSPFIFSTRLLYANLYYLFRKPRRYLSCIRQLASGFLRSPLLLLKNFAICPKSVHFAYRMRRKGIDHIHAHFANYPTTAAIIVSGLLEIPFTFTSHAHDLYVDHTMVGRKTELAKHTFTISRYNKRYILERFPLLPPDKIDVLGSSIDPAAFIPPEGTRREGPLQIVGVGRLFPKKGFRYLVEACSILLRENVRFRCHIVGEGPEEVMLRSLINELNLNDLVIMEGSLMREGVRELLHHADIFVCPSVIASDVEIQDGIPVVLIEAMAMEVPVIATSISGIPELVVDGQTGILVEPEDPQAIADAVVRLSQEPALGPQLARHGRERALQEHDVRKNVSRLMRVFFE